MSLITKLPLVTDAARDMYEAALKAPPEDIDTVNIISAAGNSELSGKLVQCDNATFLASCLKDGSLAGKIDLIYCDPPFFTCGGFDAAVKVALSNGDVYKLHVGAYDDYSYSEMDKYLTDLMYRLMLMKDALSDTGSIFLHLDRHAVHVVKLLMDEVFGCERFVNEIIWTYKSGGSTNRRFAHKHDTILFYSKTENYKFNPTKEKSYNRKLKKYSFQGVQEYKDDLGWCTLVNSRDVWNIDMLGRSSGERLNYATQKPVALLRRIIESCSDEGDLCADFFSGSGTLAEAAFHTDRKFLCTDIGSLAMSNAVKRLLRTDAIFSFSKSANYDTALPQLVAERNGDFVYIKDYILDFNIIPVKTH